MGQNQPREPEGKRTEGSGSPHNLNGLKDRVGANFKANSAMVNNPATGTGKQSNPGKPT